MTGPVVTSGHAMKRGPGARKGPLWIFSGHGSQWTGMARRLLVDEPAFAAAVEELEPLFLAEAEFSLRESLTDDTTAHGIDRTQIQIFGVQIALAATWRSYGVEPAAIIGHSMGEVAAAVTAGAIGLDDGVRIITRRSRLLRRLVAGNGSMAAIELAPAVVDRMTRDRFPEITVAVHAAPKLCTVAGPTAQLELFIKELDDAGHQVWPVDVAVAGHSPAVEPLLEPLRQSINGLRPRTPTVPFFSTVLDDPNEIPAFDVDYWVANLRRPVRFTQAVAAAAAAGYDTFLEISPHPITGTSVRATLDGTRAFGAGWEPLVLGTLKRGTDDTVALRSALGALVNAGHDVDREALWPSTNLADIPRTIWHHREHWVDDGPPSASSHNLLGHGGDLPDEDRWVWVQRLGPGHDLGTDTCARLARVAGSVALGHAEDELVTTAVEIADTALPREELQLLTSITRTKSTGAFVEIFVKSTGVTGWTRRARTRVSTI